MKSAIISSSRKLMFVTCFTSEIGFSHLLARYSVISALVIGLDTILIFSAATLNSCCLSKQLSKAIFIAVKAIGSLGNSGILPPLTKTSLKSLYSCGKRTHLTSNLGAYSLNFSNVLSILDCPVLSLSGAYITTTLGVLMSISLISLI